MNHELADEMKLMKQSFANEVKQMKESFDLLKRDICVTKNFNNLLSELLVTWRGTAGRMSSNLGRNASRTLVFLHQSMIVI